MAEKLADHKHDSEEKARYMQQLSVYAAQVKNQAQLNEAEKETSKEYRKEIKIVEHQRNALEKGLVNEEKEVATDEVKFA